MKKMLAGFFSALMLMVMCMGAAQASDSPEDTAKAYIQAIDAGKADEAATMVVVPDAAKDAAVYKNRVKAYAVLYKQGIDAAGGIQSLTVNPSDTCYLSVNTETGEMTPISKDKVKMGSVANVKMTIKYGKLDAPSEEHLFLVRSLGFYQVIVSNKEVPVDMK